MSHSRMLVDLRRTESLPMYNEEAVRDCLGEIQKLDRDATDALQSATARDDNLVAYVRVSTAAINRNKRCLLAYVNTRAERIDSLVWKAGSVPSPESKAVLCAPEVDYYRSLAGLLEAYALASGVEVTQALTPPSFKVMVRALVSLGEVITNTGDERERFVYKGETHFMTKVDADQHIRNGTVELVRRTI